MSILVPGYISSLGNSFDFSRDTGTLDPDADARYWIPRNSRISEMIIFLTPHGISLFSRVILVFPDVIILLL